MIGVLISRPRGRQMPCRAYVFSLLNSVLLLALALALAMSAKGLSSSVGGLSSW